MFLVDDHPLIRQVLTQFLNAEPSLVVVGEATSAEEALVTLRGIAPDVILVDFSLPGMDGAELIRQLHVTHPDAHCLMVSSYDALRYVDASLAAGAHGYVVKDDPNLLIRAIAKVLDGHIAVELG